MGDSAPAATRSLSQDDGIGIGGFTPDAHAVPSLLALLPLYLPWPASPQEIQQKHRRHPRPWPGPELKHGRWHPYRRFWAAERKNLLNADVAAVGGWGSKEALRFSYQEADPDTRPAVMGMNSGA